MQLNISLYTFGFILLIGLLIGRTVCGYLCPFGLIQELMFKLPTPKFNLPPRASLIKYFVLLVFVIALPIVWTNYAGLGAPAFCEFICPAGTLEAGLPMVITHSEFRSVLGSLFALKVIVLLIVLIGSITIERFYCRVLCPLGALYGLLNRISIRRLNFDGGKCIACGRCSTACPMSIEPTVDQNSIECVRCGRCTTVCPKRALEFKND